MNKPTESIKLQSKEQLMAVYNTSRLALKLTPKYSHRKLDGLILAKLEAEAAAVTLHHFFSGFEDLRIEFIPERQTLGMPARVLLNGVSVTSIAARLLTESYDPDQDCLFFTPNFLNAPTTSPSMQLLVRIISPILEKCLKSELDRLATANWVYQPE